MPTSPVPRLAAHKPSLLTLDLATRSAVFDLLPPSDLSALAKVCGAFDAEVAFYWDHRVKVLLSRYVQEPKKLLSALREFGGIISGSAVLATILRESWPPGDLDVYCPGQFFEALIYHFAIVQGYRLLNPEVLELDEDGYSPVHTPRPVGYADSPHIIKVAYMAKDGREVDIVQSASSSALEPVAAFWSTIVQNFITPSMICIAYPSLTEARRSLLAPLYLVDMQLPPSRIVPLIRKYEMRHVKFATRPYALTGETVCDGQSSSSCASAVRFFGDEHSVVLKTMSLAERARHPDWMRILEKDNVLWWRGGYVCGEQCGTEGMRVWPGLIRDEHETGEDELE